LLKESELSNHKLAGQELEGRFNVQGQELTKLKGMLDAKMGELQNLSSQHEQSCRTLTEVDRFGPFLFQHQKSNEQLRQQAQQSGQKVTELENKIAMLSSEVERLQQMLNGKRAELERMPPKYSH